MAEPEVSLNGEEKQEKGKRGFRSLRVGDLLNVLVAHTTPLEKEPFVLIGVYQRSSEKVYGRHFYHHVSDEAGARVTVKIPEDLAVGLEDGQEVALLGTIEKKTTQNGQIRVIFSVSAVRGKRERAGLPPHVQKRIKLMRAKGERANVDHILRARLQADDGPVLVGLLASSTARSDIGTAMGRAASEYRFFAPEVSMTSVESIVDGLQAVKASGACFAVIARGGGEGMETMDSLELAEKVLALGFPVVSAVGHAEERPLLEYVVDRAFPTPTAFGNWLRDMSEFRLLRNAYAVEQMQKELRGLREKLDEAVKKQHELLAQRDQALRQLREVKEGRSDKEDRLRLIVKILGAGCGLLALVALALLLFK